MPSSVLRQVWCSASQIFTVPSQAEKPIDIQSSHQSDETLNFFFHQTTQNQRSDESKWFNQSINQSIKSIQSINQSIKWRTIGVKEKVTFEQTKHKIGLNKEKMTLWGRLLRKITGRGQKFPLGIKGNTKDRSQVAEADCGCVHFPSVHSQQPNCEVSTSDCNERAYKKETHHCGVNKSESSKWESKHEGSLVPSALVAKHVAAAAKVAIVRSLSPSSILCASTPFVLLVT